ncbi:malate dehydrogenase [bacterium]|nr:malate dehydrogenase [bacterium]
MKVAIVGGAGRVGINFAISLLLSRLAREIVLVDIALEMADGEALDLRHATSLVGNVGLDSGDLTKLKGSDIVVISAGSRRKPDQSRLELIRTNVGILDEAVEGVVKYAPNALIFVVTNPVDVLTYRALKMSKFPRNRVFGLGNVLDIVRFRSLLAAKFGWNPLDVNAFIIGEHGDAMVPLWSQASYGGILFKDLRSVSMDQIKEVFAETRVSGAEVIRKKGGAGWAVGVSITEVIKAIVLDTKAVLPISTDPDGMYGIEGVALSLPTIIGKNGVEGYLEFELPEDEISAVKKAGEVLKETYATI